MSYYAGIRKIRDASMRSRTIDGLQRLRYGLSSQIPARTATNTLLLATWNIRNFDDGKYGYRSDECYYYIAEILNYFDLIAIQEVRGSLYPLQNLRRILGSWWDFLVTDVTLGVAGNAERMAYLYDKRKVNFAGLAAELTLPRKKNTTSEPMQMERSPYIAGFRAGWAYLTLVTVHIYYGKNMAVEPRRLNEITELTKTLAKNASKLSCSPQYQIGRKPEPDNLIILGDFNIFNRADSTMAAITKSGFLVPDELQNIPGSNVEKNKHYDQIAYYKKLVRLKSTGNAGVFDFYEYVYRHEDKTQYDQERKIKSGKSFNEWRTYRMSDHLPMWIEFNVDGADDYLDLLKSSVNI